VIRAAAVENRQVGRIRRHLEKAAFKIISQMKIRPDSDEARAFVERIGAIDGQALLLEKENAALIWRGLIPVIQAKDARSTRPMRSACCSRSTARRRRLSARTRRMPRARW
jgi:hypothetical protein